MTMGWILFSHGSIAAVVLVTYALVGHFLLTDPRSQWRKLVSNQSDFRWRVIGYPVLATIAFLLLAYGLIDYGLYYFFAYNDVLGLVQYRTHERFSQGEGWRIVSIVGALCGGALSMVGFSIGKRYYLNRLASIDWENRQRQLSQEYQRKQIEPWVIEVFRTLVNRDRRKIVRADGVQVMIDLKLGTFVVDQPIALSGPELVIKSLAKLTQPLRSGRILMQTMKKHDSVTIQLEAEFEGSKWSEEFRVEETRSFKMTRC